MAGLELLIVIAVAAAVAYLVVKQIKKDGDQDLLP